MSVARFLLNFILELGGSRKIDIKRALPRLISPIVSCAMHSVPCNRVAGPHGKILMNQSFYCQAMMLISNN